MKKSIFFCALISLLTSCGGGESSGNDPVAQQIISGTLFDSLTGSTLGGATVSTLPATEEVTTRDDGSYTLRNLLRADTEYEVLANKLGYRPDRARVSVAPNSTTTADFQLDPIVNGLAASTNTVNFTLGTDRNTFLLTSTVPDTGFTVQATDSWLTATPAQGTISRSENKIISLNIDRSLLTGDRAATQVIINTSNGTAGLVLDITADLTGGNAGIDTADDSDGNETTGGSTGNNSATAPAVGTPGSVVDCQARLPCTWVSSDSAYEFVVRFSDAMTTTYYPVSAGFNEPYTIGYEFRSRLVDTNMVFTPDSTAQTTNDDVLSSYTIKDPNTNSTVTADYLVYQNTGLRILQQFDQNVTATGTMKRVTLRTQANGQPLAAQFENIPFGKEPSRDIDCQFSLPCAWTSNDDEHRVTLNRTLIDAVSKVLAIEFTVLTQTAGADIYLDAYTNASGNNLQSFGGYVHNTLAGQSATGILTQPSTANQPMNGIVSFTAQSTDETLQHLTRFQLHVYENLGFAPLWNPVWFNLPLPE